MTAPRFEYAWLTDRGRVRTHNEDAVEVDPSLGVVVVADGIGGSSAGEVASRLAADIIAERFRMEHPSRDDAEAAMDLALATVDEANKEIIHLSRTESRYKGMGTTVVVGFVGNDWLAFAHVGDSRLYRLRDGALELLTRDHSFIQEVVDQGFFPSLLDAKRYGINENILTRALGSTPHLRPEVGVVELVEGDLLLFCTDGLTGMVSEEMLEGYLRAAKGSLTTVASALVHTACAEGGLDNITLALVRVNAKAAGQ